MGKQESRDGYYYFPHTQEEYEFVYILNGSIKYLCNKQEIFTSSGDMYFIQPGQLHEEFSDSEYISFYYIKCHCYDLKGDFEYLTDKIEKQQIKNVNSEIKHVFSKIYKEAQNKKIGYRQVIESLLVELICEIKRNLYSSSNFIDGLDINNYFLDNDFSSHKNSILDEVIDVIKTNTSIFFSVEELAKSVKISESYLYSLFREVLKISPIRLMISVKVEQAKKLLLMTDMTVYGIAEFLGFSSVSHFSKVFKDLCGISPKSYRLTKKQ